MNHQITIVIACCVALGAAADAASNAKPRAAQPAESLAPSLAKGDFVEIQKRLAEPLLKAGADGLVRPDVQAALARHEFIRACEPAALTELAKRDGGAAFLKAFFADASWLDTFLTSDPPSVSYAQAAENLRLLHRHGKGLDAPIYRRLATAMALSAGKLTPYLLVERFGQIQRAHRDGLLHVSFDNLETREMRAAIYLGGNAADYEYLLNDRQTRLRDYLGACWAIAYRGDNDYGDSIQTHWYHLPFRHGLPGWEAVRAVGGVCGSLSTYGALAAKTHGVMANTVGQPGHCAYVVRVGEEWPIGNSVTWPTATSSPGWEGTGYATLHRLYEPVSKDRPRLLAANRAVWLASLQIENQRPDADWMSSFEHAISAQPLNYDVWLDYAKALAKATNLPAKKRLELAAKAAKTFAPYPEAAWAMAQRMADKAVATLPPAEGAAFLLSLHQEVREEKAARYEDWPFEGTLDWQVKQLGKDEKAKVEYFGKLLEIHSAPPPHHRVFTRVLGWGQDRFAKQPATSALFAQAMESFFRAKDGGADPAMMRNQIASGLRAAGTAQDLVAFRLWAETSEKLLPAQLPKDVHLNDKQRAEYPQVAPFPGQLLSEKGLLKVSSASQYDKPLSYPAVLRGGGFGGYFDTNPEDAPSAIVQLPGEGELSGIAIVNRYDFPAELDWALPLEVAVSTDGKAWTEVAQFDTAQPVYRIDLADRATKARYVRVSRSPGKKERFHLRNILVFGKPLY